MRWGMAMSAGETTKNVVAGGAVGAIKGGVFATLGTSFLLGAAGIVAGIMAAFAWPAVLALGAVGAIAGGIFGFSILAPLSAFIGGTWRASKEARRGSQQSVEQERQNYKEMRDMLIAQRQGGQMPAGMYNEMAGKRSHVQAEEQRRAATAAMMNNGPNVG